MRPLWRHAALLFGLGSLCLGAALGLAAVRLAGDRVAGTDGIVGSSADVTGSIGESVGPRLRLTDEQRGHIFDGIMKIHDAPVADLEVPEYAIALPPSVALQELPASVTSEIPLVEGYKFVKLEDRILLVSPLDRAVVAQMPRYRTITD
jgi:hypothetical protein